MMLKKNKKNKLPVDAVINGKTDNQSNLLEIDTYLSLMYSTI